MTFDEEYVVERIKTKHEENYNMAHFEMNTVPSFQRKSVKTKLIKNNRKRNRIARKTKQMNRK